MKRLPKDTGSFRTSRVVLDSAALASARGGLVSNFNRLTPPQPQPDCGCTAPSAVVTNSGPTAMW